MNKTYSIFKRRVKENSFFYVRFMDEFGKIKSSISVERLRNELGLLGADTAHHITRKTEAVQIVEMALARGFNGERIQRATVKSFLENLWDYDGEFIQHRLRKNPDSITKASCIRNECVLTISVFNSDKNPVDSNGKKYYVLPDDLLLTELKPEHVEKIEKAMFERGLSRATVKKNMSIFKASIREAYRQGLITSNPCDAVDNIRISAIETSRGCFSPEDFTRLMERIAKEIVRDPSIEYNDEFGPINVSIGLCLLVLAETGLRPSEAIMLRKSDITISDFSDYATIKVGRGFNRYDGPKTTKTGATRTVYCSKILAEYCLKNAELNDGELLFKGRGPYGNISTDTLNIDLKMRMKALSIDRKDQDGKIVTCYSIRHYVNTTLNAKSGSQSANRILGHVQKGDAMNQRYNHENQAQVALKIASAVGSILPAEALEKLG